MNGSIFMPWKIGQRGETMHSRIFQISKKPVEDRISEDRYYDGFVGRIADYVDELDTEEQLESIRWLAETPGIRVKDIEGETTITIVDKKAYFAGKLAEFQNVLKELEKTSLENFIANSGTVDYGVWQMSESYEDTFGFYVDDYDEQFGIITLDKFMRKADEGSVWYIGAVTDYHF